MKTTTEQNQEHSTVRLIAYTDGIFLIDDKPVELTGHHPIDHLPGVLCKGVQYFDLNKVGFINNAGMAALIDLMKAQLQQGVDTRFVNVSPSIRKKIIALGLDQILKCL